MGTRCWALLLEPKNNAGAAQVDFLELFTPGVRFSGGGFHYGEEDTRSAGLRYRSERKPQI